MILKVRIGKTLRTSENSQFFENDFKVCIDKKTSNIHWKTPERVEIKPTVAGDHFYTIFFTFENLASSISFFSPSDTTVKAPIILVFSWVNETKTTWNRLLSYSSSSKWLSETFSDNKKRLNEKMSSMKYIPLQRWCNRKNIFSWQILQKLPSKKHKTHRINHSRENTFLGFRRTQITTKLNRSSKSTFQHVYAQLCFVGSSAANKELIPLKLPKKKYK